MCDLKSIATCRAAKRENYQHSNLRHQAAGQKRAYLFIHMCDVLLPLPVHVEYLQEGLVHPLISGKPRLQGGRSFMAGQVKMHMILDFSIDQDQKRIIAARHTFILFT